MLPVAGLFASSLLSGATGGGGSGSVTSGLNPLGGAATSAASIGDSGPISFGDFVVATGGSSAGGSSAGGGALPLWLLAGGVGLVALVALLRR